MKMRGDRVLFDHCKEGRDGSVDFYLPQEGKFGRATSTCISSKITGKRQIIIIEGHLLVSMFPFI